MIKKVIHCADIHIRTYRLHEEYKEVFKAFLIQIISICESYDREEVRIVVAGDLVHQKIVISNEQLMLGTWFLRQLEKIAPVVIIAGNHDLLENNKDRVDSITPMVQFLPDANINYFKESLCYLDDNVVWCVYSIFEGNKRPNIESAKAEFGDDKTYIGLYHAPLMDSKTDTGYKFEHGAKPEIFDGCDMVMLGDVHLRQTFVRDNLLIAYPGSLIQQNFGESISKHGFLLWDVEDRTFEEFDIRNNNTFYTFKIKSAEDINNDKEILINA